MVGSDVVGSDVVGSDVVGVNDVGVAVVGVSVVRSVVGCLVGLAVISYKYSTANLVNDICSVGSSTPIYICKPESVDHALYPHC